ncbi:MAG: hypothetical protein ACXABU_04865 [Candidatus Hodarchaeales archaeon]|jgi:hypothetical protein
MKMSKILRKKRRGQLQIAETLVSVSLMLILALLLINAADQVNKSQSELESLRNIASDVLLTADEANLLRPVIYLYDQAEYVSEYNIHLDILNDFITFSLQDNLGFVLRMSEVQGQEILNPYIYLIGSQTSIIALQQGGDGVQSSYFVGSFSSSEYGHYTTHYLVELYLWEKI